MVLWSWWCRGALLFASIGFVGLGVRGLGLSCLGKEFEGVEKLWALEKTLGATRPAKSGFD